MHAFQQVARSIFRKDVDFLGFYPKADHRAVRNDVVYLRFLNNLDALACVCMGKIVGVQPQKHAAVHCGLQAAGLLGRVQHKLFRPYRNLNTLRLLLFALLSHLPFTSYFGLDPRTNTGVIWGLLMGLLSAVIAFFLQWGLYRLVTGGISTNDLFSIIQIVPFSSLWYAVALIFAGAGIVIGVGGSLSAIRQFLKV